MDVKRKHEHMNTYRVKQDNIFCLCVVFRYYMFSIFNLYYEFSICFLSMLILIYMSVSNSVFIDAQRL